MREGMYTFFETINAAREDALQRFGRDLPREHQASALCHLAETPMMFAEDRAGKDYVCDWLKKIDAHLDHDDARAAAAIIGLKEPTLN